jgi:hypothetical protein
VLAGPSAKMSSISSVTGSRSGEEVGFRRGHSSWRHLPIREEGDVNAARSSDRYDNFDWWRN